MRRFPFLLSISLLLACGGHENEDPLQHEWLSVLNLKKAAIATPENSPERQKYVDRLARFAVSHPDHQRAQTVYAEVELAFARDLAARGMYEAAIPYYRDLVSRKFQPEIVRRELDQVMSRRYVDLEKFLTVKGGMTLAAVETLLGKPVPGWSRSLQNASGRQEAWFYRRQDGGIAGVYFSGGRVLTTELVAAQPGAKTAE